MRSYCTSGSAGALGEKSPGATRALEGVLGLFQRAHAAGLKGLTVFPADSPMGRVLVADSGAACDGIACQVG
jgi:hypothetical protein